MRLAFGVTGCFAVVEALDWDATFLAPLLAANMLVKTPRPPSLAQGFVVVILFALSTAAVLLLSTLVISNPQVLIMALIQLLFLSFYAHRRGAPDLATLLPQISAVSLPIVAVLSPDGAGAFARTLVTAGFVALLTVWAAHAAFPAPAAVAVTAKPATATSLDGPVAAARYALLDTLVLMPLLTWFILNATEAAIVVLIVVVTLLRQTDRQQGKSAALGLILGNFDRRRGGRDRLQRHPAWQHAAVLRHGVSCGDPDVRWPDRDRGRSRAGIRRGTWDFCAPPGPRTVAPAGQHRRGVRKPHPERHFCLGLRDRRLVARGALVPRDA